MVIVELGRSFKLGMKRLWNTPRKRLAYDHPCYGHFLTYDFRTYDSRVSISNENITKSLLRPPGMTYLWKFKSSRLSFWKLVVYSALRIHGTCQKDLCFAGSYRSLNHVKNNKIVRRRVCGHLLIDHDLTIIAFWSQWSKSCLFEYLSVMYYNRQ